MSRVQKECDQVLSTQEDNFVIKKATDFELKDLFVHENQLRSIASKHGKAK